MNSEMICDKCQNLMLEVKKDFDKYLEGDVFCFHCSRLFYTYKETRKRLKDFNNKLNKRPVA